MEHERERHLLVEQAEQLEGMAAKGDRINGPLTFDSISSYVSNY